MPRCNCPTYVRDRLALQDLPPSSIREFCRILEEFVTEALQNEAFKIFWVPVDPTTTPGYDKVVKKPMDLSTLRMNIIRRKYVTVQSFLSDLSLIQASSIAFNKEKNSITKLARKLENTMKLKIRELRKQFNDLEKRIKPEYERYLARPTLH
jgi:bromodomain adjacent to zinc finger domain protein 1A